MAPPPLADDAVPPPVFAIVGLAVIVGDVVDVTVGEAVVVGVTVIVLVVVDNGLEDLLGMRFVACTRAGSVNWLLFGRLIPFVEGGLLPPDPTGIGGIIW
jgi:hypothetical protein